MIQSSFQHYKLPSFESNADFKTLTQENNQEQDSIAFVIKDLSNIHFLNNVYDYNCDTITELEPNHYDNKMIIRGINYGMNPFIDLSLDSKEVGIK